MDGFFLFFCVCRKLRIEVTDGIACADSYCSDAPPLCFLQKYRFRKEMACKLILSSFKTSDTSFLSCISGETKQYSYKDIKTATDGFRRIIENSSNGVSYNAKFRDGQVAVIKEVRVPNDQDYTAFYKEVQLLGRLHHRHIAALYGFFAGRERFLVLEDLGNGSLKDHLSDPLKTPLSWTIRLRIAVSIAAALEYLLFFCDPPVSHAYISSSTIMLDENLVPKLSYVSLLTETRSSRLTHSSRQESSAEVDNTPIFQLGLVILELITGQSSEKGQVDLVQWVQESHLVVRSMNRMIDPDLGNDYNSREVKCLINAARMCLESVNRTPRYASRILRYLKTQVVTLKAA